MTYFRERFRKTDHLACRFNTKLGFEFTNAKRCEDDVAAALFGFYPSLFTEPAQQRCAKHTTDDNVARSSPDNRRLTSAGMNPPP